ncbi:MAG: aspartate/glutamate racemase family protein [Proteobacteria bacterium]|nr:aspartate/glutamate racemase family protein [Burkholderiales bacterium]
MGPLASADFLAKLIAATPATRDAEHIPVIVWSVPQIPDRLAAIEGRGASPVPMMLEALHAMARCGAIEAVIACNTAHHWYPELVAEGGLPILHIADAASAAIARVAPRGGTRIHRVALLATRGTHAAGFYAPRLAAHGQRALEFDERLQQECIDPAIDAVKAHRLDAAARHLADAIARSATREVDTVLLACTELPLAYAALVVAAGAPAVPVIDATAALAEACVHAWRGRFPVGAATEPFLPTGATQR